MKVPWEEDKQDGAENVPESDMGILEVPEICQSKKRHLELASKYRKAKIRIYSSPRDKSLYIPLVVRKVP